MRLGLIADIHADFEGLEKALSLLDRSGVDRILCAGDLVERGYEGDRVIDLIRSRDIASIKGNHEFIILHKHRSMQNTGRPDGLGYREMQPESIQFIQDLPEQLRLHIDGLRIIMGHGAPWDDFTHVAPDSRPSLLKRVARQSDADIVILGHTHQPMRLEVGPVLIINPGSIYRVGSRTCAVLSLPDRIFSVYHIDSGEPVEPIPTLSIPLDEE